jgi:hypothetical protein
VLVTISDSRNSGGGNNMNFSLQLYLNRLLEETLDSIGVGVPGTSGLSSVHYGADTQSRRNIRDACLLACVAALTDTKLPTNTIWQDGKWLRDGSDVWLR